MILCRMSAFARGPITIAISYNFYIVISVLRHIVALHEDIYMKRLQMAYIFISGIHRNSHLTNLPACRMNKLSGYPTFPPWISDSYSLRFLAQTTPGCTWLKRPKTTHLCVQPHIGTVLALHTSTSTMSVGLLLGSGKYRSENNPP